MREGFLMREGSLIDWRRFYPHPPPVHRQPLGGVEGDGAGVGFVFGDENTRGEGFRRIGFFDRNDRLTDNRAGVVMLIYEMHCASGDLCAVF